MHKMISWFRQDSAIFRMSDLSLNAGHRDDAPSPRVKGRHPSCEDDEPILIKIKRRDNTGKESFMGTVVSDIYIYQLKRITLVLLNLPDFMILIFNVFFFKKTCSVCLIFWCPFH